MDRYTRNKKVTQRCAVAADLKGQGERGDTLIEVLLALFVLGLTALALIIAFSTSISASQRHREIATANIVLSSVSQQAISQIEQQTSLFGCGYAVQAAAFVGGGVNFTIPANYGNYTAAITNVQYWNGTGFQATCIAGNSPGSSANAPMEITVTVTGDNESYSNNFVVDLPSGNLGLGPDLSNGVSSQLDFGGVAGEATSGTSGVPLAKQPVVSVLDTNNEIVQSDRSPIVLSIEGNPANATLSGCSANDPDGVATFSGCTITGPAGTYLIHATVVAEALDSDPSGTGLNENSVNPPIETPEFWETSPTWWGTTFKVTIAGAPDKVVFAPAPVAGASGANLTTQPTIKIETAANVVDTTQNGTLTLTLSGGTLANCSATGGVTVNGETLTVAVHAGQVSLTNCQFSGAIFYNETASPPGPDATKYTITASYSNSAPASSPIFVTAAGPANKLVFITQPSGVSNSTNPSATWPSSFSVEIEDVSGNPVWTDDATNVTVKFAAAGETLNSGCKATSVADSAIAVFSTCNGSAYGGGLKLTATYGTITATSAAFSISKTPQSLVFTTQPEAGPSGSALTTQPVITIYDGPNGTGNVDTGWSGSITLTSSTGGTLSGCTGLTPNDGVINVGTCLFAGNAGTPYTLTASLTGTSVTQVSAQFTPSQAGTATQLQFTTQPVAGPTAGSLMSTQPVVKIEDSQGNVVTSSSATLNTPTVSNGGSLTGCESLTAVNGVVNLSGCSFGGQINSYYTMTVTSPGLTSATSQLFASDTAAGTEAGVLLSASPTSVSVSNVTNVQLTIEIVDAWGNETVSNGTTNLTVSSTSTLGFFNTSETVGGTVGTSTTVSIPSGASSGTLYYGDEGAGVPTITAYNNATVRAYGSTTLTVNPDVGTKLVYGTAPPSPTTAGSGFSLAVWEEDQYGNVVTTDNTTAVSIGASNGPSTGGFSCLSASVVVNSGVATFQNCSFTSASTLPYTVTASASGLTSATATTTVSAGAASKMAIWAGNNQTAKVSTAFAQPLSVLVTDSSGNPVAGTTVTFTSPNGTKSGTFLATAGACVATGGTASRTCTAVTNASGIASSLSFTASTATGTYNVTATASGVTTATFSETNSATGATLAFLTSAQNFTTVVGSPTTTSGSIIIQAQDGNGNPVVQTAPLTVNLAYVDPGVTLTTDPATVTIQPGTSSVAFTLVASNSTGGGTVAITASTAGAVYASAMQSETVHANAAANVTVVAPTSPQTVAPGASVSYPVKITNSTGTNLYYKVFAVNGLYQTEAISACSAVTHNSSVTINETVATSTTQDSGSYTLDFVVESFTTLNFGTCGGTNAYYQGDGTLTVKVGAASSIAIASGYGQSTTAGSAFNNPLTAVVTDANGNPVAGTIVTFTSPTTGAGGTFLAAANGGTCLATGGIAVSSCTATTNANGIASSLTFTANAVSGGYTVSATAAGLTGSPLAYEEENQ
jgi:type II secretory pathway pseudopilin PulG